MSRKHFNQLAAGIAKIKDVEARRQAAEVTAEVCAQVNDRFDRSRFMKACNA